MVGAEAVYNPGFKQQAFLRHPVEAADDFRSVGRAEFNGEIICIQAFFEEAKAEHSFFGGFVFGGQFFDIFDLAGGIL